MEFKDNKIKDISMFALALLILGKVFLLIVFNNIPSSIRFFGIIWFVALAYVVPRIFITKTYIFLYLFAGLYLVLKAYDIYLMDWGWFIFDEIFPVVIGISIYTYFVYIKDLKGLAWISIICVFFLAVTAVVSIIGYIDNPLASRQLSSMGLNENSPIYIQNYKAGIAHYGILCGMTFLIPQLIANIKKSSLSRRIRIFLLVTLLLFMVTLIQSTYTSFVLYAFIVSILSMIGQKYQTQSFLLLVFIVLVGFLIPRIIWGELFYWLSQQFEAPIINNRLQDLAITFRKGIEHSDTHFSYRAARIPLLLRNFYESPILGKGIIITGHVFWLDRLAGFGLIGLIPWFLLLKNQIQFNLSFLSSSYKYFYIITFICFFSLGFMKHYGGFALMAVLFIVVPGMGFLNHLFSSHDDEFNSLKP